MDPQDDGVQGFAAGTSSGVLGRNNSQDGTGVTGVAPNGTGVFGESLTGTAVGGRSASGSAVYGFSASGWGVWGRSGGAIQTAAGVYGLSTSTAPGVMGIGHGFSSFGVFGASDNGSAGHFQGNVTVTGTFTALGAKSAAVEHPDGSLRRLYCQESPEPWFEDFGTGALAAGRAAIRLDADFAAVVKSDDYAVFLTPEGDCKGLYVTAKTPAGFEVREIQGGTSAIPFRFRLVAKRKDIPGPRLERVERPKKIEIRDPSPAPQPS